MAWSGHIHQIKNIQLPGRFDFEQASACSDFKPKGGETVKKIKIREVETLKTTAAIYDCGCGTGTA